jgi:hypothetical protein
MIEYHIPNIMGTFYQGNFAAGRSYDRTRYFASVQKEFITGNDYKLGALYEWDRTTIWLLPFDSFAMRRYATLDGWAGKSFAVTDRGSNLYFMGRFYEIDFRRRPEEVGPDLNPLFHDQRMAIGALGMYRENFLATALVYGYGITEFIPTGYRAEMTGGYSWDEFGEGTYLGINLKAGGFFKSGYYMGDIALGGYLDYSGRKLYRSTLSVKGDYFTNLFRVGNGMMRQFLSIDWLWGINRAEGVDEYLRFTRESGPRYFRDYAYGRNRLVVGAESVLFTQWNPIDFRMTLFGFMDAGWLGNHGNVFRNNFYTSIGAGVRFRNEMLVFNSIELSFSIALGRSGLMRNYPVMLEERRAARFPRFNPVKPQIVPYL